MEDDCRLNNLIHSSLACALGKRAARTRQAAQQQVLPGAQLGDAPLALHQPPQVLVQRELRAIGPSLFCVS